MLLVVTATAWSNVNNGGIKGKLVDQQSGEAIAYASIALKKAEQVVTGGMSSESGEFSIDNLAYGEYTLEVQFIGYQALKQTVTINAKQTDIGTLRMQTDDDSQMLSEVVVVAERSSIEQKIDRKVVNVGKDLTTVGATASDILGNIPSLHVDQDGNLSLRGNTNVRVLIDGRPSNMDVAQLLKQIPSSSIKSVELITNPSAKYNPEGMSGIINIILHKNTMDGINGSLSSSTTFARTPKFNNNLNLNWRKGKINVYGNVGHNMGEHRNDGNIYLFEDQSTQLMKIVNDNESVNFKVGLDWYIDDRNTLSAYTNQAFGDWGTEIYNRVLYPLSNSDFSQNDVYDQRTQNRFYNLAYKHAFEKPGHSLDFEATYNNAYKRQEGDFVPEGQTVLPYQDHALYHEDSFIANLDYNLPLNEVSRLEFGAEARMSQTDNDYVTTRVNAEDAGFTYDFEIYSVYGTWGQKWSKFSYQIGARLESYNVEANYITSSANEGFKNDYLTVYPSAYLNYTPSETSSWNLSMSRRVDRPSIDQTKPIRNFATPRVTSLGNPELLPQFTNSVELNYTKTFGRNSVTAGVFLRDINDQISQTIYADPDSDPADKMMIMSFANFDKNTSFGFDLSANLKPASWWDIMPGIDFSSINQKGLVSVIDPVTNQAEFQLEEVTTNAFNARINNNFRANSKLSFSLFGFYRGEVEGIQNTMRPMYRMDIGARYAFLNNKANLSLRFTDVFDTMYAGFNSKNPYPGKGEFNWESQSFIVSFMYNFGSGKNRAMQRKNREDNTSKASGVM